MYNFKGEFVSRKKVDLRGSSRGEENREQVLQRTRREREKRRRQKLELESATRIQASWRGFVTVKKLKAAVRQTWISSYGQGGENLDRSCLSPGSTCIPELLLIMDVSSAADTDRLSQVCELILSTQEQSALRDDQQAAIDFSFVGTALRSSSKITYLTCQTRLLLWDDAVPDEGALVFCQHAQGQIDLSVARTARLLLMCLEVLEWNRSAYLTDLKSPFDELSVRSEASTFVALLETLTSPATWSTSIGMNAAAALVNSTVCKLTHSGMYSALASILRAACPIPEDSPGMMTPPSVPRAEHLALHLVKCHFQANDVDNKMIDHLQGPLQMLVLGCLWLRCPKLKEVGGFLCHKGVPHQNSVSLPDLIKGLQHGEDRPVDVALAFLGNVAQLGGEAVLWRHLKPEDHPDYCLDLASMVSELVKKLPFAKIFNMDIILDDEEEDAGPAYIYESGPAEWDAEGAADNLVFAAQDLFESSGQELLESLVQGILPHVQQSGGPMNPGVPEGAAALCGLFQLLLKTRSAFQRQKLLLSLALSGEMVQRLWYSFLRNFSNVDLEGLRDAGAMERVLVALGMLCQVYSCFLVTAGSEELCRKQEPLALKELHDVESRNSGFIVMLKQYLWQVTWLSQGSGSHSRMNVAFMLDFQEFAGKLLGQLYDCNARWKLAPPEAFHISDGALSKFVPEATAIATALDDSGEARPEGHSRAWQILYHASCLVPFPERAKVFSAQVDHDRTKHRATSGDGFMNDGNRFVTVRRSQLLYDGFNQLNNLGEELKSRVRIRFIDEHGLAEAGVDGGGLFKDFMEELVRMGFDPQYGLFTSTEDNQLYPNPAAPHLMPDALDVLGFLGRMLGKAMYEGMLLELPLAGFFLKKFRSSYCDINDLPTLDSELYRSLLMLRNYEGDVGDLSLNFTVVDSVYGDNREVELKPGGKDVLVGPENSIEYIHRVADYRLNKQVQAVSRAFLQGFFSVIRPEWVKMFSADELQTLISGSEEGLNLSDMQANVEYAGGYHEEHPVIVLFWQSMASFSPDEQRRFLRFVTACSRAPLLGFRYLQPKMCIQMAGSVLEPESLTRLPTAATCMNILKLPPYTTIEMMLEKLLYSVNSGAGFDLS